MRFTTLVLALGLSLGAQADDHSFDSTKAKIEAAMQADIRTDAEKERDRNRLPLQTLEFFGLRDDMRIMELIPGGGWYTKILAPVVKEKGEYYAALGAGRVEQNIAIQPGFEHIKVVAKDAEFSRPEGSYHNDLNIPSLGATDLDMVFTFRNYHNLTEQGRAEMNRAVFEALKPGGVYAVIDHTTRHMEPPRDTNRRRVDPVVAIKEILDAGFEFEGFSTLHRREDDELRYEVGVRSVTGNTDRWTFKFVKPAN